MDTGVVYGLWGVFIAMLLEQAGVPFPSTPALLAGGALAGIGKIHVLWIVLLGVLGSLAGDLLWFYIGRFSGAKALAWLCRIAIQPDSCVRRTENLFLKYGVRSLIVAKWVPGFNTMAPPLAGLFRVPLGKFLLYDSLGAALYIIPFIGTGVVFAEELDKAMVLVWRYSAQFLVLAVLALAAYILFRLARRHHLLRKLRMAKITPEELRRKIEAQEPLVILDVRSALDRQEGHIPGSIHFLPEEVDQRLVEIPRDREVILFCACPNDVSSAAVALKLRDRGILNVRPLMGGWTAWRALESETIAEPNPASIASN